ncbi:hypothetical protein L3V82_08760 [Thiotrichales bacterium 19S3-7]|nr:hypothetical protein [Thiotrichales bacterium 19S3-7]MCF6802190.1 hypothetical protein [Thiotrichales bacterium 19S3-11]
MGNKNRESDLVDSRQLTLIDYQKLTKDYALIDFYVPEDLIYFKGHFDGCPILAGIAQLDLAIDYACKYLSIQRGDIASIDAMKFMKVIKPKTDITLELSLKDRCLIFRYLKGDVFYSQGKIRLKNLT